MFAGCIEQGHATYGNKLLMLANSKRGLAGIPYDYAGTAQIGTLTVVEQNQCRHPYAKNHHRITQHPETGVIIAGWLRIDNRKQLHKSVNSDNSAHAECDHNLVLASYLKWGAQLSDHLIGDFSLVVHDPRIKKTWLIRDQIGTKPLYYYHHNNLFLFATSLSIIKDVLPKERLGLNQRWLALYLLNNAQDWRETAYRHILKVPPAHVLSFSQGLVRESRYFEFKPEAGLILPDDADYVDAYLDRLDQAIRCRAFSDYPVGAESSGGMDSSTIAVMASKHIDNPKKNFHTFGFSCYEKESACIAAVSQSTPMCATHVVSQGPPLNNVQRHSYAAFTRCVGVPCEHYSSLSHTPLLELANKLGVRSMMSGFGGDEFVTAFAALTRVELLQAKQWRDWVRLFPGNALTSPMRAVRWLSRYKQTNNRFGLAHALRAHTERRWQQRIINDDVNEQYSLQERVLESNNYDAGYTSVNGFALGDRWSPKISARLESSSLYAAKHDIEYSWPLLDLRLVTFFLSVPSQQKMGPGGMGRYLHRRAISGIVPDIIVNKTKEMGPSTSTHCASLFDIEVDFPHLDELPTELADLLDRHRYNKTVAQMHRSMDASDQYRELINFVSLRRWLDDDEH